MNYLNSKKKYINKAIASALIAGSLATTGAVVASNSASAAGNSRVTITFQADPGLKKVLDGLVTKGTITAAQETAILDAVKAAAPVRGSIVLPQPNGRGGFGLMTRHGFAYDPARVAVITSTLNLTLPQIQTQLRAGKSLADIAGSPTAVQNLINALVAYDTKAINAKVSASKVTPQTAATQISGLTAKVTAEVNAKGDRTLIGFFGIRMPINPNAAPQNAPSSTPGQ
jgi:hypothetical protein